MDPAMERWRLLAFDQMERGQIAQAVESWRQLLGLDRRQLHELGALDTKERLTPLGRKLARLPVDERPAVLCGSTVRDEEGQGEAQVLMPEEDCRGEVR